MRFALLSLDRPRKLAKRLRTSLSGFGIESSLTRSQHLVARMLGYRDWQELASCIGREGASPDDLDCDKATVEARKTHQVAALVEGGVPPVIAGEIVTALHPT